MQAQLMNQGNEKESLVRNTLRANVTFSVISGLLFTLVSAPVAELMGVAYPIVLTVIGVGLLPFAYVVYRIATQMPLNITAVRSIIAMDISWIIGSYIVLAIFWTTFTTAGRWLIFLQAEAVFFFALFQYLGLRRLK